MDERKGFSPPPVGGASRMAAFAVLCLTAFALLSLATVEANGRLADGAVRAVTEYYAADSQAQEVLARLRAGELPEGVEEDGDVYRYTCPISDVRELAVEVRVQGTEYTVLRWQAVPVGEWETGEGLELWDGVPF